MYTIAELAQNASALFGENIRSECIIAAFKDAEKDLVTLEEAKEIVKKFMKREVI